LLLGYGAPFILFATREYVYSLHFQYPALVLPFLVGAVPHGIESLATCRRAASVGLRPESVRFAAWSGLLVAALLVSLKFGAVVANDSFKGGWNRIERRWGAKQQARYAALRSLVDMIPPRASVAADNEIAPHITSRPKASQWPAGADSDYLLLHTGRYDEKERGRVKKLVDSGKFEEVARAEGFTLYRRLARPGPPRPPAQKKGGGGRRPRSPQPGALPPPNPPPAKAGGAQ
jgi:hypothetical protein